VEVKIKRRIAIGAAGLTILGGGGGAYALADRGGDDERQAFMSDAAKRLHVSPAELRSALKGAMDDRIQADVKNGRLTQKQADAIKAHKRPGGPGERGKGEFHVAGPFMEGLGAAAKYLDLSDAALRKQLQSGKSLAQVAKDRNKSVDGLKTAIKGSLESNLDARVNALVNQSGPPGPPKGAGIRTFRGAPGHGPGGPGGPPDGPPPPGF
jgi:AraC-like DNA-binding protein